MNALSMAKARGSGVRADFVSNTLPIWALVDGVHPFLETEYERDVSRRLQCAFGTPASVVQHPRTIYPPEEWAMTFSW